MNRTDGLRSSKCGGDLDLGVNGLVLIQSGGAGSDIDSGVSRIINRGIAGATGSRPTGDHRRLPAQYARVVTSVLLRGDGLGGSPRGVDDSGFVVDVDHHGMRDRLVRGFDFMASFG